MSMQPYPICGPKAKEIHGQEQAEFRKRFEEAKHLAGKEVS
ncbi:hypothetical protein SD77_3413 [Bacillus badius]|uniref:Uncharacterized protein n=1 Tax=Bacillus badius TaxID=1455 RepID=A0ABR5ANW3_BACBA|nr:hypothetical protein SD77_3413 [Bacillus badius]KIL74852.1 hypothetical protein SD78_1921 [Bacillus badius]